MIITMVSFTKYFFRKNSMFKNKLPLFLLCMSLPWCTAYSADLNDLSKHSGVSVERLEQAISVAQFQPKIVEAMTRPYESKQWWEYRNLFISKSRAELLSVLLFASAYATASSTVRLTVGAS